MRSASSSYAPDGDPRHADRHPPQVLDGMAERHLAGQHAAHVLGGELPVRDEQDAAQAGRRVEPHGFHAIGELRRDDEPAEQHRGGIVGMRLDRGGDPEQPPRRHGRSTDGARERVAEDDPANRRSRRRPEPTRQRDAVVHPDPPPERARTRPERRLERRLEPRDESVRARRCKLADAVAGHRELDRPIALHRLDRDPVRQLECEAEAVVAGTEVGR